MRSLWSYLLGVSFFLFTLDEDWIKSTMEKIDLDGDGGISLEEFVGMNAK